VQQLRQPTCGESGKAHERCGAGGVVLLDDWNYSGGAPPISEQGRLGFIRILRVSAEKNRLVDSTSHFEGVAVEHQ
jgi:hypothetical protein